MTINIFVFPSVSLRVAELLDYTAEELTGMNMYTLCHGEDVQKMRKCHLDREYLNSFYAINYVDSIVRNESLTPFSTFRCTYLYKNRLFLGRRKGSLYPRCQRWLFKIISIVTPAAYSMQLANLFELVQYKSSFRYILFQDMYCQHLCFEQNPPPHNVTYILSTPCWIVFLLHSHLWPQCDASQRHDILELQT